MARLARTLALLPALLPALPGCSSDPPAAAVPMEAGVPDAALPAVDAGTLTLYLSPSAAFEGQRRFVGQLSPAFGADDLSAAGIAPQDPASGIVIDDRSCTRSRCAIVAHIEDRTANRGAPVPAASDGRRFLIVTRGRLYTYTSALTIFPLDAADASSNAAGHLAGQAIYSSLTVPAGQVLRPAAGPDPVRIVVMGATAIHGRIDLSPGTDGLPVAGGGAGGTGGEGGVTDGGGMGGSGNPAAGGGGGYGEPGLAGHAADGSPAGGGGPARGNPGLSPLLGGAGGGGSAAGPGGAGAGAILLAGFGDLDLDGAAITAHGGAGQGTGGGGSGGGVFLAGQFTRSAGLVLDLRGGEAGTAGGASGGSGGGGRLRLAGAVPAMTVMGAAAGSAGASFAFDTVPAIVRSPTLALRGRGLPGSRVEVREALSDAHPTATATVAADGTWSATLTLPSVGGPARLVLREFLADGTTAPSFSGTALLTHVDGPTLVFDGAAVDMVYLPTDP